MSENLLIRQGSPTLAGIKTGNLFPCVYENKAEMCKSLRAWNRRMSGKGLRVLPLRYVDGHALIYVYRPNRLRRDLGEGVAAEILQSLGYPSGSPSRCLGYLTRKLREAGGFPHEIGLFLGYPPEDVRAFMEHPEQGCKCVGCWKVYGDEVRAKKEFAKYKKCTAVYRRHYSEGTSLDRLTVTC